MKDEEYREDKEEDHSHMGVGTQQKQYTIPRAPGNGNERRGAFDTTGSSSSNENGLSWERRVYARSRGHGGEQYVQSPPWHNIQFGQPMSITSARVSYGDPAKQ